MTRRRVTLTIDELVLDGVEAGPGLAGAVEQELGRLLAQRPPDARRDRDVVDAGALGGAATGESIAAAVHRGIAP